MKIKRIILVIFILFIVLVFIPKFCIAIEKNKDTNESCVKYQTHIQDVGWQSYKYDGDVSGLIDNYKKIEGIRICNNINNVSGKIEYQVHVEDYGWQEWKKDNELAGTEGKNKRLEAIKIKITDDLLNNYDVYYRVYCENYGWLDWTKNGRPAGSEGLGLRLEALEIKYIIKGGETPEIRYNAFITNKNNIEINYGVHVEDYGWQASVNNGEIAGTTGKKKRIESIYIDLYNQDVSGDIQYKTYIQDLGWQDYVKNGEYSGTTGKAKRLEAIQIQLTGELTNNYDIYYRVHVQDFGWLDWAKNGETSGTEGYSYRIEAIQIKIQEKGTVAPGNTEIIYRTYKEKIINNALNSLPKYIDMYYTEESSATLKQLISQAQNIKYINNLSEEEINELIKELNEAALLLENKIGTTTPVVYIDTDNSNGNTIEKKDGYVKTNISIVDLNGTKIKEDGQIKVRGNTTSKGEKKPYTIKFEDKQNVLGMGKAKKWALLANLYDPTGLRNSITFDLAKKMNLEYTSEYKFVEVYIDGVYKGVYQLVEPVEEGKTRVNIDLEQGEFLIELEKSRIEEGATYLMLDCGLRFLVDEPEEPTEIEKQDMLNKLNTIVEVMKNGTYEELKNVVDIESFAKFYILNEYLKPIDFDFSSVRFYYKNGKLYAGPVWDYDLSTGNTSNINEFHKLAASTQGTYADNLNLYKYMFEHTGFMEDCSKIYKEYSKDIEDIYVNNGNIDSKIIQFGDVFEKNITEAGWDCGKLYTSGMKKPYNTYEENVSFLKEWLSERKEWMDSYFNKEYKVLYKSHVSNIGWMEWESDENVSGTEGRALGIEGINIALSSEINGNIEYQTHIRNIGWESVWKRNGEVSGTVGKALPIEAIRIRLKGMVLREYDIYYRTHVQNLGWLDWVKNGGISGTEGKALQIEAIQIKLIKK